jgi:hypothetical protein
MRSRDYLSFCKRNVQQVVVATVVVSIAPGIVRVSGLHWIEPCLSFAAVLAFFFVYRNSLAANLNLKYDHGNYREHIEKDKAFLEKLNLNAMYKDTTLTGFDT